MSKIRNLYKRGNMFYGRVAAPRTLRELRKSLGLPKKDDVHRSLGTSDLKVAERLVSTFLDQCYREFEREEAQLQADGAKPLRAPTADDLAAIRRQFLSDTLRDDELERKLRTSPTEVEAMREELRQRLMANPPKTGMELLCTPGYLAYESAKDEESWSIERREILKSELTTHLIQSEDALVAGIIEACCHANGLVFDRGSFEYKSLARDLLKEWIKALEVTKQRDQGIYDSRHDDDSVGESGSLTRTADAQVVELSEARAKRSRNDERIKDHFQAYLKECKPKLRSSDLQAYWATLRQFVECNGDKAVTEYGRSDMSALKKELRSYPTNAARIYPGVPFKKVLQRNRTDGHPTLNSNTVRSKLSMMSAFGKWLEENVDGVDASNFSTNLPKRDDRQRMEPFTLGEVGKILNSHAFIGCESDRNYSKPGKFRLRDWHFWFTLIAAFTGARTNEIMQMDVTDLREEKGVLVFDFTDEGDGKSLKTKGSKRLVPVHPMLIELGLVAYRDRLVARGVNSLFEDAPVDKDGRRARVASKWFRKFLGKIGVKGQHDLGGAHRWRHTMADALRRADVDQYDIAAAMGHEIDISRMNRHYGREMDMSIDRRLDILSKAEYPGVDFSLLMP